MKKLNILLGFLLIAVGAYFLINDWPTFSLISILLLVGGIVSVASDLLFSPDEPNDERRITIKIKSGHLSYLFSIIFTFFIILLFNYGIIQEPLNGLIIILIGNVLVFPLTLFYYNKSI